jgi:hypothetical protein
MRRTTFLANLATLIAGGTWLSGQQQQPAQPYKLVPPDPSNIRSGPDIGFRVNSADGGRVLGRLVVRLKTGEWVDAELSPPGGILPLETR